MSLIIKGLDMPKGCDECPLTDGIHCKARDKDIKEYVLHFFEAYHEKPTDCPLVEIPTPHGRLVDADELQELYADIDDLDISNYDVKVAVIRQNIKDMPTIIEAEE